MATNTNAPKITGKVGIIKRIENPKKVAPKASPPIPPKTDATPNILAAPNRGGEHCVAQRPNNAAKSEAKVSVASTKSCAATNCPHWCVIANCPLSSMSQPFHFGNKPRSTLDKFGSRVTGSRPQSILLRPLRIGWNHIPCH
jgi:hypothetical protein